MDERLRHQVVEDQAEAANFDEPALLDEDEMLYKDQLYRQTPEQLAAQLTGVPLPVNALSWWARGLPSPTESEASSIATSPEGYASSFEQAGWQLTFSRYAETAAGSLPGKIAGTFQSSDDRRYSFKLVISRWSFPK